MDGYVQIRDSLSGQLPKLFPLGYTPAESPGSAVATPQYIELKPGQLISDLARDYVLYTPALMYMVIPWPVDPWMSFCQFAGYEYRPVCLEIGKPVIGNVLAIWSRNILLLPRSIGELAIQYFGTLAVHDPFSDTLYRVRSQEIRIPEPYQLSPVAQYVDMTAAVVESTAGSHFYVQQHAGGLIYPWYRFDKDMVFDDTVKFQAALKAANNPYEGTVNES